MSVDTLITSFYISIGYAALTTIFIILCFAWTPASIWIKARIIGGAVIISKPLGLRAMDFFSGKPVGKGILKVGKGHYYISEESGVLIKKGKIAGFMVPSTIASTTNMDYLTVLSALEGETGNRINDFKGYVRALREYKLKYPNTKKIQVPLYKAVPIRDLNHLFNRNVNTDLQEAAFANERAKANMLANFSIKQAIPIFVLLMGVGLAALLIKMAFGGDGCPDCSCIMSAVDSINASITNSSNMGVAP